MSRGRSQFIFGRPGRRGPQRRLRPLLAAGRLALRRPEPGRGAAAGRPRRGRGRAAAELEETDAERLAAAYSGLFEVGSSGAPVPLREELAEASAEQAKEENLRFYHYFGYVLAEERQWSPDHLSVQLEFLHFLAYRESRDPEAAGSCRRAQRDFLERHPRRWFPEVLEGVHRHAEEPYWRTLFEALGAFLDADADWLGRAAGPAGGFRG